MIECHGTKSLLERHNDSLKIKRSANSLHSSLEFGLSQFKSSSKKTCWLTKSLENINKF